MRPWKAVYMIGIKGVGMTALAQILQSHGLTVSGSDTAEHFFTEGTLKNLNIPYVENFSASHVPLNADAAIYSTAYGDSNPEVQEVKRKNIPIFSYPEAVALFFNRAIGIAVAGSHGKTTTTAMLGLIFSEAGEDPNVLVGSEVPQFNGNARSGKGKYFILEADEYQNKFQYYNPKALIVTAIDWDHPDFFSTPGSYQKAFEDFVARVPHDGVIVACGEDKNVVEACKKAKAKAIFYTIKGSENLKLRVPGRHNKLNAMAAATMAGYFGIKSEAIEKALEGFKGTKRRLELKYQSATRKIYDDYAHTPREIEATLSALRELYPKNYIVAIFQPHTFSRTKQFLKEFAQSFRDADEVIFLPIYASAREQSGWISSEDLAAEARKHRSGVSYFSSFEETSKYLKSKSENLRPVLITMGAGDVWRVGDMLFA